MTKRKGQKDKQHNGQKKRTEGQPTQWPKEKDRRTDNTMAKRKRTKRQTTINNNTGKEVELEQMSKSQYSNSDVR
jgi:hypothetical protein